MNLSKRPAVASFPGKYHRWSLEVLEAARRSGATVQSNNSSRTQVLYLSEFPGDLTNRIAVRGGY